VLIRAALHPGNPVRPPVFARTKATSNPVVFWIASLALAITAYSFPPRNPVANGGAPTIAVRQASAEDHP
jgi:hypothetical protein